MHANELSLDEKVALYRDGFVIVREAVPRDLTFNARRAINMHVAKEGVRRPYHDLSGASTLPDLVNLSPLGEIMRTAMGPSTRRGARSPRSSTRNPGRRRELRLAPARRRQWYSPDIPKTADDVDSWVAPRTPHFGTGGATEIGANKTPFFRTRRVRWRWQLHRLRRRVYHRQTEFRPRNPHQHHQKGSALTTCGPTQPPFALPSASRLETFYFFVLAVPFLFGGFSVYGSGARFFSFFGWL